MPSDNRSPHFHGRSEIWSRADLQTALLNAREALGTRLRRIRNDLDLSLETASERIGIHAKHLQRIETGRANVTIATLVAITVAYETSLRELFE